MDASWIKNLIGKLKISLIIKRLNSPSQKINVKAKSARSQIGQQLNVYQGMSYSDTKDLIISIIEHKLDNLKREAKLVYEERKNEFLNSLLEKAKNLVDEEIAKLREPDTQLALIDAVKISGRKTNPELRNLLANLVIGRIKNDKSGKEELKNLVYNEAILTISKLTIDQIKIITLCYLSRYGVNDNIFSWETFNEYLEKSIRPFLDFKNTDAEFQHLEYAGCGSIGIGRWELPSIWNKEYSFLFMRPIQEQEITNLNISEDTKQKLLLLLKSGEFYKFKNKKYLQDYLKKEGFERELESGIWSLYIHHLQSNPQEITKTIKNNSVIGSNLIDLWNNSLLKHLNLTSVGIVIAASYFEQITKIKIDIDIWIN